MPKVVGIRERRQQPFYDTLFRADSATAPSPTVAATTKLFAANTNMSNTEWTNMNTTGMLASDNTLIVLAMRCFLWAIGTYANKMLQLIAHQLYLTLFIGDKPQFLCPAWFLPQGGGIWGMDSATPLSCNGVPSHESILKFAKPLPIPARQHFYVEATFYDTGATCVRTEYVNTSTTTGQRECKILLDGIHTRDVL